MTRFFITLNDAVKFVFKCLNISRGQEIFIPIMNSIYIYDLIKILDKKSKIRISKIRPGEKIHEVLCEEGEIRNTYRYKDTLIIYPEGFNQIKKKGKRVPENFSYSSNSKIFINPVKIKKLLLNMVVN